MINISDYFSSKEGLTFKREIKQLRRQIGVIDFSDHDQTYGVGGNTFRAFTGWSNPPSKVYRQWANRICDALELYSPNNLQKLEKTLNSKDGFDAWHSQLADDLFNHWEREQGGEEALSVAHKYKLVDLFVKWLSRHRYSSPTFNDCLVNWGNCALDSKSIKKLNECLNEALPIGATPSMGYIQTEHAYRLCQQLVAEFAAAYGGTRLLFDFWAWPLDEKNGA